MANTTYKSLVGGLLTGAALVCYGAVGLDPVVLNAQTGAAVPISPQFYEWDDSNALSAYVNGPLQRAAQIRTIHQFASRLLDGMVDPDPRINQLVSKHFWDLA